MKNRYKKWLRRRMKESPTKFTPEQVAEMKAQLPPGTIVTEAGLILSQEAYEQIKKARL